MDLDPKPSSIFQSKIGSNREEASSLEGCLRLAVSFAALGIIAIGSDPAGTTDAVRAVGRIDEPAPRAPVLVGVCRSAPP
jgi:hypothetical protein